MKKTALSLLLAGSAAVLFAQNTAPRILCGNDLFQHLVREKYPELHQAFDQTFEQARPAKSLPRNPLNIRVVVHVVWNAPEENLPDSVIQSQIEVLNEDFNRLNPDTANLRSIFQPYAGNADIHFVLEEIVRVPTTELFAIDLFSGNILAELKHSNQGGSDAWDTQKYLNLWVCKIQPTTIFGLPVGQILGFAFPPNGLSNWPADSGAPSPEEDGVVIDYRMIGRNNPNPMENPATPGAFIQVKGRTPTHEVGHYLGLRHIWGDGGLLGPNNCDQSDGVDDTPYANAQSEFDCDTTKNTCEQVEMFFNADMPDMVENYMDYSSEGCMNVFTQGQVALMRNVLAGPRSGLVESSTTHQPSGAQTAWEVYPNPTSGQIYLHAPLNHSPLLRVVLRAPNGQALQTWSRFDQQETQRLDLGNFPQGIYFLEIMTPAGSTLKKVFKKEN